MPNLLDVSAVAECFGVDVSTVRRMIYRGDFPNAFKAGREWRIPKSDVNQYVDIRKAGASGERRSGDQR